MTIDTEKLSRREREKLQHRQLVLEAGIDLFSQNGYHNVSMQEIANRAEFATGTLYSFFQNKEDLYRAIMFEESKKFEARLDEALGQGADERERLDSFVTAKGQAFADNIRVVRLWFAETRGASFNIKAGLRGELRESYERTLAQVAELFRSGTQKGLFRSLDPRVLALALDSLTNAALFNWLEDPENCPYEKCVATMKDIFFGGVEVTNSGGERNHA